MKRFRWWLAVPLCLLVAALVVGCAKQETASGEDGSKEDEKTTEEKSTEENQSKEEEKQASENEKKEEEKDMTKEAKGVLRMATTTSTADTGLLDYLAPIFLEETGWTLEWTAVGTGEALKMGENGDVDIVLVHSKASEEEFVANGFGVERFEVMYNDFVIVGPKEPIAHNDNVQETFKAILDQELTFVSRGDDSGTHKKEKKIWKGLELDPATNSNYLESGQGMGATLTMADEKNAYCLTDRGTWLKMKSDSDVTFQIDLVCEGAKDLLNQYGVIAVNPEKHDKTNIEAANAFIEWICSEKTQTLIGGYGVDKYGQPLFTPNAKK